MEKLNYYHRERRPSFRPGLRDQRWEDVLVVGVAGAWALLVFVGTVARLVDGNAPPDTRGMSGKTSIELIRAVRADRQALDVMLLLGGAGSCAIAAGVAHRVRSGPRGWTFGLAALVATCAFVGLLGFVAGAAQLSHVP